MGVWTEKDWQNLASYAFWSPQGNTFWSLDWKQCPDWPRFLSLAIQNDNPYLFNCWLSHHDQNWDGLKNNAEGLLPERFMGYLYRHSLTRLFHEGLTKMSEPKVHCLPWGEWLSQVIEHNIDEQTYRVLVRACPSAVFHPCSPFYEQLKECAQSMLDQGFLLHARELFFAFPSTPQLWGEIAKHEQLWRTLAIIDDIASIKEMWRHIPVEDQGSFAQSALKWSPPGQVQNWFSTWIEREEINQKTSICKAEEEIRRL